MTPKEIAVIRKYRSEGMGYKRISALMGISPNTVKAYFRRHSEQTDRHCCPVCGKVVKQPERTRKKKYCSDECRKLWWKENQALLKRTQAVKICLQCGKEYSTHKKGQKYCSRECYAASLCKEVPYDK